MIEDTETNKTEMLPAEQPEYYDYNDAGIQLSVDTVVHFGAGYCNELDAYLALKPQRIILVEADPLLAEILGKRTNQLPQVKVECAAVAGQPGPVNFHRYNLPDAGSIHAATGLFRERFHERSSRIVCPPVEQIYFIFSFFRLKILHIS